MITVPLALFSENESSQSKNKSYNAMASHGNIIPGCIVGGSDTLCETRTTWNGRDSSIADQETLKQTIEMEIQQ